MARMLVHGGAGNIDPSSDLLDLELEIRSALAHAVHAGQAILVAGGPAVDAVMAAVVLLEDCPYFNAGKGSVLNRDGEVEMDACIIDGATREAGAVAGVRTVRNPIIAARAIVSEADAVLMAGSAADAFARTAGCAIEPENYFVTTFWRDRWIAARDGIGTQLDHSARLTPNKHGTVGAVAIDASGRLAAATSTGGLLNKPPGRISDSALPGAGTYASGALAVSFTGTGEAIIRLSAAARMATWIDGGVGVATAATCVLAELAALGGDAGLIALDARGNIALSANTTHLLHGWIDDTGMVQTALAIESRR